MSRNTGRARAKDRHVRCDIRKQAVIRVQLAPIVEAYRGTITRELRAKRSPRTTHICSNCKRSLRRRTRTQQSAVQSRALTSRAQAR